MSETRQPRFLTIHLNEQSKECPMSAVGQKRSFSVFTLSVRFRGQSRHRFERLGGPLLANSGRYSYSGNPTFLNLSRTAALWRDPGTVQFQVSPSGGAQGDRRVPHGLSHHELVMPELRPLVQAPSIAD